MSKRALLHEAKGNPFKDQDQEEKSPKARSRLEGGHLDCSRKLHNIPLIVLQARKVSSIASSANFSRHSFQKCYGRHYGPLQKPNKLNVLGLLPCSWPVSFCFNWTLLGNHCFHCALTSGSQNKASFHLLVRSGKPRCSSLTLPVNLLQKVCCSLQLTSPRAPKNSHFPSSCGQNCMHVVLLFTVRPLSQGKNNIVFLAKSCGCSTAAGIIFSMISSRLKASHFLVNCFILCGVSLQTFQKVSTASAHFTCHKMLHLFLLQLWMTL